ncbi:MAG: hypothetical protein JNJ71_06510 [Rubrivivax sp.]|nr:hypothetical protein [Rubrivivax sp.]
MKGPAGRLVFTPGAPLGAALRSTRREWAPLIGIGRPAAALPGLLASVFALCGGAHRVAGQLAVAAARGEPAPVTADQARTLALDTLREHLRRWWLDAPRQLPADLRPDPSELGGCPLMKGDAWPDDPAGRCWIEDHVLGESADTASRRWNASWEDAATAWTDAASTWPARAVADLRYRLQGLSLPVQALPCQDWGTLAPALATDLLAVPGFALNPVLRGQPAETGPWLRAAAPLAGPLAGAAQAALPVWLRGAARVPDVLRLCSTGKAPALQAGSLTLEPGLGVAWCEMARGHLLHLVRLQPDDTVAECRVLAPTEWNFHPQGVVARALSALPANTPSANLQALAAAFDPCVEFHVERDSTVEDLHA